QLDVLQQLWMLTQHIGGKALVVVKRNAEMVFDAERLNPCTKPFEQRRHINSSGQAGDGMGGMVVVTAHGVGVCASLEQEADQLQIALRDLVAQQEVENRFFLV